ncbi:transposase [Campylobacter ureolyticus]|uniref:transposase n=1 Tax=Campylobacter ureolyticus TaxID=827 RepID=UPI0034C5E851
MILRKITNLNVDKNTEIHTDENSAYDDFIAIYNLKKVNYQIQYSIPNGINNNQSESFN